MKVLTWNVNRAGESRTELWKFLQSEDADIVLLQEVIGIPRWIWKHYQCFSISPRYYEGGNAAYSTAVLSKGPIDATPYLSSELEWVNKIYTEHPGWIIGCETTLSTGEQFRVISVHLLAKSVPRELWADVDVSGIKLTNNPDIWLTEILYALLSTSKVADGTNWIVAGDFNSSVKFDFPVDKGNREIVYRMGALGLTDCLSHFHSGAVPTFQNPRGKVVEHQLDYFYVNAPMLDRLKQARVPDCEEVFNRNPRLSDHLPVVCEFG